MNRTALVTIHRSALKDAAWRDVQTEAAKVCSRWGSLDISPVANGEQSHVSWCGKVEDVALYVVDYKAEEGEDLRFDLAAIRVKFGVAQVGFFNLHAEGAYLL